MARGVTVQVLLLAPTTQAAQDRAAEIQDPAFDTRIEGQHQGAATAGAQG